MGPIIFRFPTNWHFDGPRLQHLLDLFPAGHCYAFDLSYRDWLNEFAYRILEAYGVGLCIQDCHGRRCPNRITSDFVYVRLHGPC